MPHTESSPPRGTMLRSTACVLATVAFVAGLLAGSLAGTFFHPAAETAMPVAAPIPDQGMAQGVQQGAGDARARLNAHITEARNAIARAPDNAENWVHLGNLHYDADQPEEAIVAYENALRLSPDNPDVLTDLGTMYRQAGHPARAVELYARATALAPDHQNARLNRGVTLLLDLARPDEGLAAWRELLAIRPDAALSDGTRLATALPSLLTDAGLTLEQRGQTEAALHAYALALEEDADFEPALAHRAALLDHLNRPEEARPLWARLFTLNPEAMAPNGTPVKDRIVR